MAVASLPCVARLPHQANPDMRILVIGAGYAGAQAATAARRRGADVLLIDPTGDHEFLTRLAAVAGGRVPSGDGWAPAADLLGVTVERAAADQVLTERPAVRLEDGRILDGDAVVLSTGAIPAEAPVTGLASHALPLRTVADALTIRRQLVDHTHAVVIGGGPTGVQLAHEAGRRHQHLRVTLVETGDRLMPNFPERLGTHARHLLLDAGIDVRLGAEVTTVHATGAVLADGTVVDGLPVWAGGYTAVGNRLLPDAEHRDGRLVVDDHLRVPGTVGVFAAGDVADHHDLFGNSLAMSAQIADRAGTIAGRNAVRHAHGEPLSPAVLFDLGWVVGMDDRVGVGQVGPFHLALPGLDRLVPFLHTAVDVKHLFQVGGFRAVAQHATGRHRPDRPQLLRVERPGIRGVG